MPNSLIAFLADNPNCVRADLFTISLPNGQTLYATDGQFDITIPSGTLGWTGSASTISRPTVGTFTSTGSYLSSGTATTCAMELQALPDNLDRGNATAAWSAFSIPSIPADATITAVNFYLTGALSTGDGFLFDEPTGLYGDILNSSDDVSNWSGTLTSTNLAVSSSLTSLCGGPITTVAELNTWLSTFTYGESLSSSSDGVSIPTFYTITDLGVTIEYLPTYKASQWGQWSRGAITSDASFDLHSNTMDLTCIPQAGTLFPGTEAGILSAALNGLFDACEVTVQTVYMPFGRWGYVAEGVETKFVGQITDIQTISRNLVKFQCADYLYLLNVKVPTRIIQANCPWGFADANCGIDPASKTVNFTAASGTTAWTLVPATPFVAAAGYYTQGVVKCLTGANSGLSQAVKIHAAGNLQVTYPWIFVPSIGDTFSVIAGCDKSVTTCTQKFNNLIHFGGMPFCPPPVNAI
jgi:uncharacterized phage protein (TIGR02218 family)